MKILVSACLLGENCKYNGGNNKDEAVLELSNRHTLVPVCPECFAGLPCPRPAAEIRGLRVYNKIGEDVTKEFSDGAEKTLYVAEEAGCQVAILKKRSPSCGFGKIYDGTFSGRLVDGNGITADLLYKHGIRVLSEDDVYMIDKL